MYGSDHPGGGSGGPGSGFTASPTTASSSTTASRPCKAPLLPPGGGFFCWDNYKGSPMLELWAARTRSR